MTTPRATRATSTSAKPIILSVDDDPGVSRAVVRDLRRRYGGDYRTMRAESGPAAIDLLRETKLRGKVAIIVADYRMPGMNGIEFLEAAMDLHPFARRVLLTAYADTDAAINAINVVDLDYYLLKPWDPPEEKLYPVIDALLDAWRAADHRPITETKVVGHRWSARCSEVREFLARNQVAYRWFFADEPEGAKLLDAAGADATSCPVIITADGEPLVDPADAELAGRVGLATTPVAAVLRPHRGGRRACRSRRRGVRRVRRAADRCSSSAPPPVGRRGKARESRITSAFRTGCRAASLPTARAGRPPSSAPS